MPGRLVFSTTADGASVPTERMRIDSSGRVGIGTSSPVGTFHVQPFVSTAPNSTESIYIGGGSASIGNQNFNQGGGVKVTIKAPGYTNTVNGHRAHDVSIEGGDIQSSITSGATYAGNVRISGGVATNTSGGSPFSGQIFFSTSDSERMRIDSSGRLGIGTTSPATGLSNHKYGTQLESAANGYYMPAGRMYSLLGRVASGTDSWVGFVSGYGNSSGSCNILLQPQFNNTSQQAGAYIGGEATASTATAITFGHMVASSSATGTSTKQERVRIDSSGRLLVGTSTTSTDSDDSGTSGGKGTIMAGRGGPIVSHYAILDPSEYLELQINTVSSGIWSGFLSLTVADLANGSNRRHYLYAVFGANQYSAFTATSLADQTFGTGTNFGIAYAATGKIRITNNSSITEEIAATFIGALV